MEHLIFLKKVLGNLIFLDNVIFLKNDLESDLVIVLLNLLEVNLLEMNLLEMNLLEIGLVNLLEVHFLEKPGFHEQIDLICLENFLPPWEKNEGQ